MFFGDFVKMNTQVLSHVENVLDDIRTLFLKAATRVEGLKAGEKVPATKLAEELAKELGKTGPSIYPILVLLFKGYPGVEVKKGAMGGIYRPLPGEVPGNKGLSKPTVGTVDKVDSKSDAPLDTAASDDDNIAGSM